MGVCSPQIEITLGEGVDHSLLRVGLNSQLQLACHIPRPEVIDLAVVTICILEAC